MGNNTFKLMRKLIATPELLWQHFEDYVKHETNNPLYKREYVGKDGNEVDTPLQVPITFEGFECYLADKNIIQDLCDYSKNAEGRYEEYIPTVRRIQKYCFVQNFKGAAVGLFGARIISMKLGLINKTENKNENTNIEVTAEFGIKPNEG
jgi:DNA-packaging protein gp3